MLAQSGVFGDVSDWKSPLFTGRVVAGFAAAGDWLAHSGEALVIDDLAETMGIMDDVH